eukprot:8364965-Pyramimonas_sp.AAC.1
MPRTRRIVSCRNEGRRRWPQQGGASTRSRTHCWRAPDGFRSRTRPGPGGPHGLTKDEGRCDNEEVGGHAQQRGGI